MSSIPLTLQPLTATAFAPFGNVIQKKAALVQEINDGHTQKYADLAQLDTSDASGRTAVHIYTSTAVNLPLHIEIMERHPLGSQAFIPLQPRPFLIVVAPVGDAPRPSQVRGFFSDGHQGVNYYKGVWHHYQITLGEISDYLVIDRAGPGENFEEHRLAQALVIENIPSGHGQLGSDHIFKHNG